MRINCSFRESPLSHSSQQSIRATHVPVSNVPQCKKIKSSTVRKRLTDGRPPLDFSLNSLNGGAGSLMAQREREEQIRAKKEMERLFLKAPRQQCDITDESQTVWCVKRFKLQH